MKLIRKQKIALFCRFEALIAALAYEVFNNPIMTDQMYDKFVAPAAQKTNGMCLGLFDDIEFNKSTGVWVPRNDEQLTKLTEEVIDAAGKNKDGICHYPEFCVLIEKIYDIDLWE